MKKTILKLQAMAIALMLLTGFTALPAKAYYDPYYGHAYSYYHHGLLAQHPYVKKALIGGGIGAVAGALLSPEGAHGSGAVKGAMLGGAAGLGIQYLQNRGIFSSHRYGW